MHMIHEASFLSLHNPHTRKDPAVQLSYEPQLLLLQQNRQYMQLHRQPMQAYVPLFRWYSVLLLSTSRHGVLRDRHRQQLRDTLQRSRGFGYLHRIWNVLGRL